MPLPTQIAEQEPSMSHIVMNEETGEAHSSLACHVCKKRKIKCGRELPRCRLCEQSSQQCTYPIRAERPGPKIGSSQSRKRRREALQQERESRRMHRNNLPRHASTDDDETAAERHNPLAAASPGPSLGSATSEWHPRHMQSLSFIIHPSHESCSPGAETEKPPEPVSEVVGNEEPLLTSTCFALSLSPDVLDSLINTFFQTFTSYRLFREPHFKAKMWHIETDAQINALLASMFAFSAKEYSTSGGSGSESRMQWTHSHFIDLAMTYIDKVLRDCGDEPPPLCLLQALILTAHWLLIQGVRGRAWRYLGNCVRIAYELNLHLVDAGKSPDTVNTVPSQWCEDEERRRAWWAIWELDVFASVIRRCPTAIDWSQNETFLPAEDEKWFREEPQKSCKLASGLTERWKNLQATGNQSPKAWFIIVNSLMKEAQTISSPFGINKPSYRDIGRSINRCETCQDNRDCPSSERGKDASTRLSTLYNTLRCFFIALPASLKYREQNLTFEAKSARQSGPSSPRHLHSSIYSIHLMSLLTKIMICKYRVFHNCMGQTQWDKDPGVSHKRSDSLLSDRCESDAIGQYFKAADDVVTVVNTSNENHFRYVNPFLANTIWLAAAVQLLHKNMISDNSEAELITSKFEVLCMTYDQFVDFWEMSPTPGQTLQMLQSHLKSIRASSGNEAIQRPTSPANCNEQEGQASKKPHDQQNSLPPNEHSQGCQKGISISNNQETTCRHSYQTTSSFTATTSSPVSRRSGYRQQPSLPEQPIQTPSPALPYEPSLEMQAVATSSSAFDSLATKANYVPPAIAQYMDPGLFGNFNFISDLGAANMDFASFLNEVYPPPDTG